MPLMMIPAFLNASTISSSALEQGTQETIDKLSEVTGQDVDPGALKQFFNELPDKATQLGIRVVIAVIVILISLQVIRTITKVMRKSMERTKVDESTIHFMCSFVGIALKIILVFGVLAAFGMDTASIVAILGSAGVAIGLAVQGSLSNLAGGIMILLLKPFRLGDYIIEDNKGHEGTVKEISLFNTRLITPDNKIIVLPNGSLANTSLTNATGNDTRMVEIKIGVGYDTDIRLARKVLEKTMEECKWTLGDQERVVFVDNLGDSSITLGIRCWVKAEHFLSAKWELNEKIKIALDEAHIEIPFPQLDVHMKQ
ncbi:MAG: mechanosensitive ion channel family protein [Butyrivibrio sp.]|jgi:small conductance mechanosensitive channel|nr:mechanosensitive ion channel family protein [Butyrivibrio sp.]